VIVSSYGGTGAISWWRNDGGAPENWVRQDIRTGFTDASAAYAADINGDGHLDVVGTATGLNQVAWWRNNGGNPIVWAEQVVSSSFAGAQTAMAADIDGDGKIDIVAGSSTGNEVAWWRNSGGDPIAWSKSTIDHAFAWAHNIYACDINADSRTDVVGAAYSGSEIAWWRNEGGNPVNWTKQTIQSPFQCALVVHVGDIDNDSQMDVVASSACAQDDITWWRNSGADPIVWTANTVDNNYNGGWPVYISDLDGDGDQDVIAGADTYEGGVLMPLTWWENRLIVQLECSASQYWGWGPLAVDFQAASTHNVTNWIWDFGDGDSAFAQSPSHTYQSPGTYNVALRIVATDTVITRILNNRISVLADTVLTRDIAGNPGREVEAVVEGVNYVPLKQLVLPVDYAGQLGLSLDSFSVAGCRTQVFDSTKLSYFDSINRRAEFTLFSVDGNASPLPAGRGPILKLYFRIPSTPLPGATSVIKLDGFTGHSLKFAATNFEYVPVNVPAAVSLAMICGDASGDGSVDISDAVFLIQYIFSGGPAPNPILAADTNCDSSIDISDAVYLIQYIFSGGPAPCALCK
jgi:hypothetical protein